MLFVQRSSTLEAELRARGQNKLIITGTLTNACCESSARDAAAPGFLDIMVSDAMATRTDVEHNATLVNVMKLVAGVRTTDEVERPIANSAGSTRDRRLPALVRPMGTRIAGKSCAEAAHGRPR